MSMLRRALKKLGITDRRHFDEWLDKALKKGSPHRRLFDAYDKSLAAIELAEMRYEVWLRQHWDDKEFEVGYRRWDLRLKRLRARAMVRLERTLQAYKRSVSRGE